MEKLDRKIQLDHLIGQDQRRVDALRRDLKVAEERLEQKMRWRDSKPLPTPFDPALEGFEFILSMQKINGDWGDDIALYHKNEELLSLEYFVKDDVWNLSLFMPTLGMINGKSLFKHGSIYTSLVYRGPISSNEEFRKLIASDECVAVLNNRDKY